jgi:hypothetical protein
LRHDAEAAGEDLALASLAAELLILELDGTSTDMPFHAYSRFLGRGQYPKMKLQPITSTLKSRMKYYNCESLEFWNELSTFASLQLEDRIRSSNAKCILELLQNIPNHISPECAFEENIGDLNPMNLNNARQEILIQRNKWLKSATTNADL